MTNNRVKEYDYLEAVPIEHILYAQFIKYDKLNRLFTEYYKDKPVPKWINIYIDVYQTLLPIFSFYKVTNPYNITACIANLAIHYKSFFRKAGIDSFVFLLYSPTTGAATQQRFCPEYNGKYTMRMINNKEVYDMVNQNIPLIQMLCQYMNNIFFKMGTVETSVMAYDMITKFKNRQITAPSLFITSSQYAFQLPSKVKDLIMLYKKKPLPGTSDDTSYLVTQENALDSYIAEIKKQHIEKFEVNQSWLSGFMTLSGIPKRNLKSLFNYKQSLKILKSIDEQFDQATPDSLFNVACKLYPNKGLDSHSYDEIVNRFRCIDLDYQLYMYRTMPEAIDTVFLEQVNDPEALKNINDQYFSQNPILLEKL